MSEAKIKILTDGPYEVSGAVPLDERRVVPAAGGSYTWETGRELPQSEHYYLCRCGQSKNPPFCDGTHALTDFDGTETADRRPYAERARRYSGTHIDVADDGRCAFVRLCHAEHSEAWTLAQNAETDEELAVARAAINACPTGRITAIEHQGEHTGEASEPLLPPRITITQDPQSKASAGIYVQGGIPLASDDGTEYETRQRYMLCRCGKSCDKPFCDARHIPTHYDDGHALAE